MASQNHRPGATVSLSPAAYAKDKMKRVENLENQLHSIANKKNDEHASKLRMQLCEILSDVVLTDPEFALKNDAIGRLWRGCFYGPIGVLRQRISREKKKKDSNSMGRLQKSLNTFIAEAITLYEYLISQYHSKLLGLPNQGGGAANTMGSQHSQSTFGDSQQTQAISNNQTGVVPGLFRMYIHVGDLYRYDSKYKEAQQFYGNASKLSPGRGNPYNQIAVVAQLKDAAAPLNAVALYWYARSLLTTHEPFEISKANLSRLFQSNRDWFHKQPPPPDDILNDGNGGREMVKSQRSVASRHFLSQFVDLHYSFFQGIGSSDNKGPTDQEVVNQIEGSLTPLAVLLRNSAFGDPLLCKMVAICAFSEAYRPNEEKLRDPAATKLLARIFTLSMGSCLAERAAVGLAKIKDQPEKMGNPGKAPSSVRLLLPLLLVCEYIESSPVDRPKDENASSLLSKDTREFCDKTVDNFWQKCVDVLNILINLRAPLNLVNEDWRNSSLKEFDTLVGFLPFQSFLKDDMASSREEGYASAEEAVEVLHLNATQGSHQSSTQDSAMGGTTSVEEYKVKVARLLAFGDRAADDSTGVAGRRFGRNMDGSYVWKEEQEVEEEDTMMDVDHLHDNDTQPPVKGGDDVLVYSVPEGGGPALLVPGMLLQNRAMGNVAGGTTTTATTAELKPPSTNDGNFQVPGMAFGAPAAAAQPTPPTLAATLGMAMDPQHTAVQQAPAAPTASAPAAGVMPPPGFGGGGLAAVAPAATATVVPPAASMPQGHVAMPQGQIPIGTNLGIAYGGGAPLMGAPAAAPAHAGAMPPGFAQGFGSVMPQQQQTQQQHYQPTLASSMHLFGGPEALKTENPFALASMPSVDASGNMPLMDLNLGGGGTTNGNGASFLNPGASGGAESSLLGSGLLHSLFEDSGADKTTKNPFAT